MSLYIPPTISLEDDPRSNYKPFKDDLFIYARSLCSDIHTTGMLFSILNDEEWNQLIENHFVDINGDDQIRPRPDPTDQPVAPANNDGPNHRAAKAHQQRVHSDEQIALNLLRRFIIAAVGPTIVSILGDTATVSAMPILDILTRMFELYGEPDDATITSWEHQLTLHHSASDTITKTCARHAKLHTRFATAGQPLSDFAKIKALKAVFNTFPAITEAITDYEKANPSITDRNCTDLINHLIRQQSRITTGSAGFTANAAVSRADVLQMIEQSTAKAYAAGLADGVARGAGGGRGASGRGRGGAGRGRVSGPAGRGAPVGAPRSYCYVHGYDGHPSARCFRMATDATGSYTAAMKSAASHTAVPGGSIHNL